MTSDPESPQDTPERADGPSATDQVVAAFGGIRPMAHKLDVPVSTVQGWKQRNAIPENRIGDVVAAATAHNVDVDAISAQPQVSLVEESEPSAPEQPAEAKPDPEPQTTPSANQTLKPRPVEHQSPQNTGMWIAVAALVLAVGAIGWLAMDRGPSTSVDLTAITERLDGLERQAGAAPDNSAQTNLAAELAELRDQLQSLADNSGASPAGAPEVEAMQSRLEAAEAQITTLENDARDAGRATSEELARAQDEIAGLRDQVKALSEIRSVAAPGVSRAVGLALATGRLQRALDTGAAYDDTLVLLERFAGGDEELAGPLDQLVSHAVDGIPTRSVLTQRFSQLANDIVISAGADEATGWTDRALNRVRSVVTVRPIGSGVSGDGTAARVARAEAMALSGDLAGAVGEIEQLTGAAAQAAATWLADAQARLAADAAISAIEARALAGLQANADGS